MDKTQFIRLFTEKYPHLKKKEAEYAVKVILDAMCGALAKGGRIEIRGFGSFSLSQLPPRQKCSSGTGFKFKEPPRYIPGFKPAKELRARVSDRAGIAEIDPSQSIPQGRFEHEVANDPEQVIYA